MRVVHAVQTFVAALALLSSPALAQRVKADEPATPQALERLNAYAEGVTAAGQFSGIVLVAKNGEVVFERAYGLRDEKHEDPLKVETRFDLASAGKMFTATAILQQIAAGKLTLTTTLGDVLPDYPNVAMRKATIYQLLTHSAGAGETDALFYPDNLGQAVGYVVVADERMPNCFAALDGGWPAGGQSFTARDMLRFVTALRQGRLGVPHALFEQATTPKLTYFGLGFFATDYGKGYLPRDLRWGHGGMLYGQCVDVRTYEMTGETIITLANNGSPACYRVAGFLREDWKTRNAPRKP